MVTAWKLIFRYEISPPRYARTKELSPRQLRLGVTTASEQRRNSLKVSTWASFLLSGEPQASVFLSLPPVSVCGNSAQHPLLSLLAVVLCQQRRGKRGKLLNNLSWPRNKENKSYGGSVSGQHRIKFWIYDVIGHGGRDLCQRVLIYKLVFIEHKVTWNVSASNI